MIAAPLTTFSEATVKGTILPRVRLENCAPEDCPQWLRAVVKSAYQRGYEAGKKAAAVQS